MKYFENRFSFRQGHHHYRCGTRDSAATARRAAKEGAKVVLVDKRAKEGEKVLKEIRDRRDDFSALRYFH